MKKPEHFNSLSFLNKLTPSTRNRSSFIIYFIFLLILNPSWSYGQKKNSKTDIKVKSYEYPNGEVKFNNSFDVRASFNGQNGKNVRGTLLETSSGKIYGLAYRGGTNALGTLFEFDPDSDSIIVLYNFGTNGYSGNPMGSLIEASNGKLYGMNLSGGTHGDGTLFEFDISAKRYTDIIQFNTNGSLGGTAFGSLIQAQNGKLYGTTSLGPGTNNYGVLFEFNPNDGSYKALDTFGIPLQNGARSYGHLLQANNGKLYGTTHLGGDISTDQPYGLGTVYSYDITKKILKRVAAFTGITTGTLPVQNSIIQVSNGLLYGMTNTGGEGNANFGGDGTIYMIDPVKDSLIVVYNFNRNSTGAWPQGTLVEGKPGYLYGTTSGGTPPYTLGTLFEYNFITDTFKTVLSFNGSNGSSPNSGALLKANDGKLYGMTTSGGAHGMGTIYSYDPNPEKYIELETKNITNVEENSAQCNGVVISGGGLDVIRRGVCWNTSPMPTINNDTTHNGSGTGEFTAQLSGLEPNTVYYIRAYASLSVGTAYGAQKQFTTQTALPVISGITLSELSSYTVQLESDIIFNGGAEILNKGFCIGTSPTPDTLNSKVIHLGSGDNAFRTEITTLIPNTTYYVRSFAVNQAGISYSSIASFTPPSSLANILLQGIDAGKPRSCTCDAIVVQDGGSNVTKRGVCYSTKSGPSVSNDTTLNGSGTGDFKAVLTDLIPHTQYFVRAYAVNSLGTSYSNEISFLTSPDLPEIKFESTFGIIEPTSASYRFEITDDWETPILDRGICWTIDTNVAMSNINKVSSGAGNGSFSSTIECLQPGTRYFAKGYASNVSGTGYTKKWVKFTTPAQTNRTFTLGERYGGGIIFYLDCTKQHGLIAYEQNLLIDGLSIPEKYDWCNCVNERGILEREPNFIGSTRSGIGDGAWNTGNIYNHEFYYDRFQNFAAKAISDFSVTVDGIVYDDWYLPSKDELNLLFQLQNIFSNNFCTSFEKYNQPCYYWSSTEISASAAWMLVFPTGTWTRYSKTYAGQMRPIRIF